MLHSPGTLAILRILTLNYGPPPYARLIRRRRQNQQVQVRVRKSSWTVTIFGSIGAILSLYGLLCAGCAAFGLLAVLVAAIPFNSSTAIGFVILSILLMAAAGIAVIGAGVSRVITVARTRNAWDLLLMLPHPRHEVILYVIAPAYSPALLFVSLSVVEIFTVGPTVVQSPNLYGQRLVLLAALTVEWAQIMALAVTVGILSARGDALSFSVPVLFGIVVMLLRAGAGWLVARLLGVPATAFLFAGPTNGIVTADLWPAGLVIAVIYLAALEIIVRRLFAGAISRTGE
jgi:hypothetical protein